jgi:hypothetical protein
MKRCLLACWLLGTWLLGAEESAPPSEPDAPLEARPAVTERATFIPHPLTIEPFTPPPPKIAKALEACRIDASVARPAAKGTTLTLQLGEASAAPDLPGPPPPLPAVTPGDPTLDQIARHRWYLRHNFFLGATIFDHRVSVLQWTDRESATAYEAVCGFDLGLLAGTGGFVHQGENYSFMLMHSHISTEGIRRLWGYWNADLPEVAEGQIIITKGDPTNPVGTAPAILLGKVIEAEKDRLVAFQAARDAYLKEAAAWTAAHPPVPRNETFIFRPHRGSRYLKPEGGAK